MKFATQISPILNLFIWTQAKQRIDFTDVAKVFKCIDHYIELEINVLHNYVTWQNQK